MGDGALTGQWVAVTHCNELGEDKKKKEEQHGILGDVIDPAMQYGDSDLTYFLDFALTRPLFLSLWGFF